MRPDIEEAINAPGPVTLLKKETEIPVDRLRDILRKAIKNEGAVTLSHRKPTELLISLSGEICLVIESSTRNTNGEEYKSQFLSSALEAIDNYDKHALVDELDQKPMCAALLEDFFNEHEDVTRFEEEKRIRLKSQFDNACIWTPREARFRAAPQWTRSFTLLSITKSVFHTIPVIALDPLELSELNPVDDVDPLARMWAAARVNLFKHDPEISQ
tara:strand:- start:85 stop:729 length:645 start_codon:yes stop_codon:yes gene_type:complete